MLLTAAQIAERTGRQKRIVLRWFERGCPHQDVKQGPKGQVVKVATMEQVGAWLKSVGMVAVRGSRAGSGGVAKWRSGEVEEAEGTEGGSTTKARGSDSDHSATPPRDRSCHSATSLFEAAVADAVHKRMAEVLGDFGSAALRMRLEQTKREFDGIVQKQLPVDSPVAEMDRRATAMKNLSGEMRQLEDAIREVEIKSRRYVLMEEAQRAVREMAAMLVSDLDRLPAEISPTVAEAVEPMLAVAADGTRDTDSLRRLVMAAVRDAVARVREERAGLAEDAAARLRG